MAKQIFSAQEELYIAAQYDGTSATITRLLNELGKGSRHNICRVAQAHGYKTAKKRKAWSAEETALLRSLWGKVSGEAICKRLGRTYQSINLQRKRAGGFSTRDDEGHRIIDLERMFKIDHRQWQEFKARGWLKTYELHGRSGVTAVCASVQAVRTLLREHPEIVDISKAGRVARTAFELWTLPDRPKWKRLQCQSDGWKDGTRLTPDGFQIHHGNPTMKMREHSFSMPSCKALGGVRLWTELFDQSPSCPRCGSKVSRYSPDATFADENPGNDEAIKAIAGKVGLTLANGKFVDASGNKIEEGELLRYVFSTKRNPGKAVKVFATLLAKGLRVAAEREVDESDMQPHIMKYRLTAKQTDIVNDWLAKGAASPLLRPGSGKTVIGATAMTRVKGRHALFVNTKTIAEHWVKHLQENAPEVTVKRLTKPSRTEVTVHAEVNGNIRCVIEIWSYMTRHEFGADPYKVILFDEAHHLPSNKAHRLALINAKYRMALSATPYREDGREALIEHMAGRAIHDDWKGPSAAGLLIPRFPIKVLIVKNVEQKFAAVRELVKGKGRCLVFAEKIAEGKRISAENNIPFIFSETENRLDVINNNRVVAISRCGDAGMDIPDLETIVELSFLGKSRAQSLQRAGRLMHSEQAKQHCVLVTAREAKQYMQRFTVLEQRGFPLKISVYEPRIKEQAPMVRPSELRRAPQAQWWSILGQSGRPWTALREMQDRDKTVLATA
jgi:ribosomal protein L34